MRKEAPKTTQMLSYKDIYGENLSIKRLGLVKSIPKKALIAEIAALNLINKVNLKNYTVFVEKMKVFR